MSGEDRVLSDGTEMGNGGASAHVARETEGSRRGNPGAVVRGEPLRVAFQGETGAFSEEAAIAYFGSHVEAVPRRDFAAVGAAVIAGDCDYGLLPIENSVAGSVTGAYDVLGAGALAVIGEVVRPIRHCLLGVPGARLADVRRALSHPMALAQCTSFFREHPRITPIAVYDTAGAAKEVAAAGDPTAAAVAGRRAAEPFGLVILAEDLQDRADNQTRFFAVARRGDSVFGASGSGVPAAASRTTREPAASRKTVLIAETANRPGALLALLEPFAEAGVNLTKLESRPGIEPWTYRFFLELDGSAGAAGVDAAIARARACATSLLLLGSLAGKREARPAAARAAAGLVDSVLQTRLVRATRAVE